MKKSTLGIIAVIVILFAVVIFATTSNKSSTDENTNTTVAATDNEDGNTDTSDENSDSADTSDENNDSADSATKSIDPSDNSDKAKEVKIPDEAQKFFDDFTNFQNELSRNVELGNYSETEYMDFLQKSIEIVQLKEAYITNQDEAALNKGIEEVKPYLYEIAEKINSELKDNFKS